MTTTTRHRIAFEHYVNRISIHKLAKEYGTTVNNVNKWLWAYASRYLGLEYLSTTRAVHLGWKNEPYYYDEKEIEQAPNYHISECVHEYTVRSKDFMERRSFTERYNEMKNSLK